MPPDPPAVACLRTHHKPDHSKFDGYSPVYTFVRYRSCIFPYKTKPQKQQEHEERETKRALETHIKEHRAATRRGETEKSAIAEHAWGQQHPILWEETSVLDQAKNNTTLLIKQAVHIWLTNLELINRDEGVAIPECWQLVLDHAAMTSSTHVTPRRETDDGTIDAT